MSIANLTNYESPPKCPKKREEVNQTVSTMTTILRYLNRQIVESEGPNEFVSCMKSLASNKTMRNS